MVSLCVHRSLLWCQVHRLVALILTNGGVRGEHGKMVSAAHKRIARGRTAALASTFTAYTLEPTMSWRFASDSLTFLACVDPTQYLGDILGLSHHTIIEPCHHFCPQSVALIISRWRCCGSMPLRYWSGGSQRAHPSSLLGGIGSGRPVCAAPRPTGAGAGVARRAAPRWHPRECNPPRWRRRAAPRQ